MIKTITAKKSLGQNFLTNKDKIGEIVSALALKDSDTVIEIGPGHGELTKELVSRIQNLESRIIALEKDERLAEELKGSMKMYGDKVRVVSGDILKILPKLVSDSGSRIKNYKVVGNIPYYITGFLLRILSELERKPKIIVLTVQKEVAERITAKPPHMNLLAASVQLWAQPEIMGFIPKEDFSPKPKVDSAIIKLVTRDGGQKTKREKQETDDYYKLIKILFKQPRKTIANNVSGLFKDKKEANVFLKKIGIAPASRPQDLSLEKIAKLNSYGL